MLGESGLSLTSPLREGDSIQRITQRKLEMNKTVVLMFSKDRPLQAELCLTSFFEHCYEYEENLEFIDVKVIYKTSNDEYFKAYKTLNEEYFGEVDFIFETDFKNNLVEAIAGYQNVLFLVDDNVFIGNFSLEDVSDLLESHNDAIGFSFRLGENTTYCYSLNTNQPVPEWADVFDCRFQAVYKYPWTKAWNDFSYPLELSSSYYRIEDLAPILVWGNYKNPNDLEWIMYLSLKRYINTMPYLLCYDKSVAFCMPMNKVQNVNTNRVGSNHDYTTSNLLEIFKSGKRIDTNQFNHFVPNSCHQEYDFLGGLRDEENSLRE
jgi:hypothetical protein